MSYVQEAQNSSPTVKHDISQHEIRMEFKSLKTFYKSAQGFYLR